MEKVKEYPQGELTAYWKAVRCQHSGICVKLLPEVYDPKERPWIKPGMATAQALGEHIGQCPSGALSHNENIGDNG